MNYFVSERIPTFSRMACGLALFDAPAGVDQEHAPLGPSHQGAIRRRLQTDIAADLLHDVAQRRRDFDAWRHGKRQAFGLTWAMVGVLPQDEHFHIPQGCQAQRPKGVAGVNHRPCSQLLGHKSVQAKAGIAALSRCIALDMQRFKVRSNCIAPFAWSRMVGNIPVQTPEQEARMKKLQKMTPDKIAPLAVYLAAESSTSGSLGQRYAILGVQDDEVVNRGAQDFWRAVKAGDRRAVAARVAYPITVQVGGKRRRLGGPGALLEVYDAVFTPAFRRSIEAAMPRNMFVRDQGVMLGSGQAWFDARGRVVALNN